MALKNIKVEVKDREWLEFDFEINSQSIIENLKFKALGCLPVIAACEKACALFKGQKIENLTWAGVEEHWDQMILEAISRLQDKFELPYKEDELCHCRKISTTIVNYVILLGAHTPEKVKAWTSASSGCGTCRTDVESLIEFRVAQKCQKR